MKLSMKQQSELVTCRTRMGSRINMNPMKVRKAAFNELGEEEGRGPLGSLSNRSMENKE